MTMRQVLDQVRSQAGGIGAVVPSVVWQTCLIEGSPALLGVPPSHALDALVVSSPGAALEDVFVAGEKVAASSSQRTEAFGRAMQALWMV